MGDILTTIQVDLGERSYPVHIGEGLLARAKDFVPLDLSARKIFVLYDVAVEAHVEMLIKGLGVPVQKLGMTGGEQAKSFSRLQEITDWLLSSGVNRTSVLFVVGGGVMGDLGGFAASIILPTLSAMATMTRSRSMDAPGSRPSASIASSASSLAQD